MTNERDDDEVLGRALARAIETQEPNETPYERSRIAVRPLRGGFPFAQFLGAAGMVLVIALAFGSWLTRPNAAVPAAATAAPTTTPVATGAPAATAGPASATPRTAVDHGVVYFARDGLPPIAVHANAVATQQSAEERIASRVDALNNGSTLGSRIVVPGNAFNPFPLQDPRLLHVLSVRIQGDVATVDIALPATGWSATGAARTAALVQQLVYTITEEPGIARAAVLENGKPARIDQFLWDKPLSREEVFGYTTPAAIGADKAISASGPAAGGSMSGQTENDGTMVRFTLTPHASGAASLPAFYVSMTPARDDFAQLGKYALAVVVGAAEPPREWSSAQINIADQTPLRATLSSAGNASGDWFSYLFLLDDARPWRVLTDQGRIVVEIGGDPRLISDRIAVYSPVPIPPAPSAGATVTTPPSIGRQFTLRGSARTFEANVVWRVKDSAQKIVASGHTTASLGTSAIWGSFSTPITLPSNVSGNVTLEVYDVSPKDGTDQGLVAIPLIVR